MRNPPVPSVITGFSISTGDSGAGIIDTSDHTISVEVLTPNSLTVQLISPANMLVGAQTAYEIRFLTTNPLSSGYKVEIEFPSEVNLEDIANIAGDFNIKLTNNIDYSHS